MIILAASGKTGRDNGSFSKISLTECQEALSERPFGKQNMLCLICLQLMFAHEALVLIPFSEYIYIYLGL